MLVWGIYLTCIDSRLMTAGTGPLLYKKQKRSGTNKQIDKINKIITRSVKLYSASTFQMNEKKHVREITARQDNDPNWTVLVGERWSKVENNNDVSYWRFEICCKQNQVGHMELKFN